MYSAIQSIKERRSLGAPLGAALAKVRARAGAPLGLKNESGSASGARKNIGAQAKSAALQVFRYVLQFVTLRSLTPSDF